MGEGTTSVRSVTLDQILNMSVPERWELARTEDWRRVCHVMEGMSHSIEDAYVYQQLRKLVDTQLGLAWEATRLLTRHHPEESPEPVSPVTLVTL